jgi:hypothetical protein
MIGGKPTLEITLERGWFFNSTSLPVFITEEIIFNIFKSFD